MLTQLLDHHSINDTKLYNWLDTIHHHADYSDMFFEYLVSESFILEEHIIKETNTSISQGVGLRSNVGDKTTFSYSDSLDTNSITNAAKFISQSQRDNTHKGFLTKDTHNLYTSRAPSASIENEKKVYILQKINELARKHPYVIQVNAAISSNFQEVMIVTSENNLITDTRPLVRLHISVVAHKNGITESAASGGGGRYTYEYFITDNQFEYYVEEAVRQVMLNLEAKAAPAGAMPVILGSGWPGVLLHEAIGHGLEGDFNRRKTSCFADKMGTQIASTKCSIVDNGTIAHRRGSLNVDDEGTRTQHTLLVENGILKNYMFDKLNARLMGVNSTGNGRRESYAHIPMPRMTNTYMLAGTDSLTDMLASTDSGIYAVNFSGGQVDITSGEFVFTASEAYMVKNGKITHPIKGATLIGKGSEVLQQISYVGADMSLDGGIGVCGKEGQSVPVGVGQPSLKIDNLVVGGTHI